MDCCKHTSRVPDGFAGGLSAAGISTPAPKLKLPKHVQILPTNDTTPGNNEGKCKCKSKRCVWHAASGQPTTGMDVVISIAQFAIAQYKRYRQQMTAPTQRSYPPPRLVPISTSSIPIYDTYPPNIDINDPCMNTICVDGICHHAPPNVTTVPSAGILTRPPHLSRPILSDATARRPLTFPSGPPTSGVPILSNPPTSKPSRLDTAKLVHAIDSGQFVPISARIQEWKENGWTLQDVTSDDRAACGVDHIWFSLLKIFQFIPMGMLASNYEMVDWIAKAPFDPLVRDHSGRCLLTCVITTSTIAAPLRTQVESLPFQFLATDLQNYAKLPTVADRELYHHYLRQWCTESLPSIEWPDCLKLIGPHLIHIIMDSVGWLRSDLLIPPLESVAVLPELEDHDRLYNIPIIHDARTGYIPTGWRGLVTAPRALPRVTTGTSLAIPPPPRALPITDSSHESPPNVPHS